MVPLPEREREGRERGERGEREGSLSVRMEREREEVSHFVLLWLLAAV